MNITILLRQLKCSNITHALVLLRFDRSLHITSLLDKRVQIQIIEMFIHA
ncbi:unnamed protein product, partial [Rotaria magnacalcarata]